MKKKILIASVFVLTIFFISRNLIQTAPDPVKINNSMKKDKGENIEKTTLNKNSAKKNELFTQEELNNTAHFIKSMKNEYTKLQFENDFHTLVLQSYHQNNNIAQIFKNIILDNNFALELSKEDQAYARVFAIQGLKEIALKYDKEPLLQTMQELSSYLQNKTVLAKGEQADLEDLLRGYLSISDPINIEENIELHLAKMGFNKDMKNREIYDIYDQTLYFFLVEKLGREKAKELLGKFLDT
ncbi:hypothetical protein [Fluviispira vulneris]|uniref:hypothetical protein n=1 Tax=Fluviispira vulneris TaxID=2763012 RepID=UPI0016463C8C|nr:hypothetical protein [Fluviispira vulneris]